MVDKLDKTEDQEKVEVPNATTIAAINDLEAGKNVTTYKNVDEMFADCGITEEE